MSPNVVASRIAAARAMKATDAPAAASPDDVPRINRKLLKNAGIEERVRFNDLRHTFATMAISSRVDVKTESGMLGHFWAGRMILFRVSSWATTAPTTRYPKTQEATLSSRMERCSGATCSTRDGSKTGGGSYDKEKEGQRLRHRDTCP